MAILTLITSKQANNWTKIGIFNTKHEEEAALTMFEEALPSAKFNVVLRRKIKSVDEFNRIIDLDPMFRVMKKGTGNWYQVRHNAMSQIIAALLEKNKGVL